MPADAKVIQADWENREQVDQFTQGIQKIAEFLNRFDMHVRYQLSVVDDKLNLLERKVSLIEAQLKTVP